MTNITAAQIKSAAKAAKINLTGQIYNDDVCIVEVIKVTKYPLKVERTTVRKDEPTYCMQGRWATIPVPLTSGKKGIKVTCLLEDLEYRLR